jgi:hypothetical protein
MKKIFTSLIFAVILLSCDSQLISKTTPINKGTADKLDVGQSAHDLLSDAKYRRLTIEIQFAPGMRPQDRSVNNLVSFFKTYVHKPDGITVTLKQVGSIGKAKITTQDADSFAVKNRVLYTERDLLALYIYFADAASASSWVGGVSYLNTSIVVFEKTILENTRAMSQASLAKMESSVLEHEAGHLLGLVNNGTPMITPHEDAAHRFHCTNRNCLMFHAIEGGGLIKVIDNPVAGLDANCARDLRAYGDAKNPL